MQLVKGLTGLAGETVWRLAVPATAFFLLRLAASGLWRIYPALTLYFAGDFVQQLLRLNYPVSSSDFYLVGNALKTVLALLVMWELARAGFLRHPALGRFSRRVSWHVIGICGVAAAINMFLDPAVSPDRSPSLHYLFIVERAVTTGLLLFLLVLGVFIAWFPVPMRRNVAWFFTGFCFIFAANWVSLLVSNLYPEWARPVSGVVGDGVAFVVLCCWTLATNRAGEDATTVTGHRWDEAEATRLSGQLDAIHDRLVRLNQ